jgi:hypothetical protein
MHSTGIQRRPSILILPASSLSPALFQNLCSNEAAAKIFASVEAFYRVGTLVASSKTNDFLQAGCM